MYFSPKGFLHGEICIMHTRLLLRKVYADTRHDHMQGLHELMKEMTARPYMESLGDLMGMPGKMHDSSKDVAKEGHRPHLQDRRAEHQSLTDGDLIRTRAA